MSMSKQNEFEVITVTGTGGYVSYETANSTNWKRMEGEKAFSHSYVMDVLRKIMGRTLTLIDSSITDKQQNKAMKDIVRSIISDEMEFAAEMGFDQKKLQESITEDYEPKESDAVSIEEALGVK